MFEPRQFIDMQPGYVLIGVMNHASAVIPAAVIADGKLYHRAGAGVVRVYDFPGPLTEEPLKVLQGKAEKALMLPRDRPALPSDIYERLFPR